MGTLKCPKCGKSAFDYYNLCPHCKHKFINQDKPIENQKKRGSQQLPKSQVKSDGILGIIGLGTIIIIVFMVIVFLSKSDRKESTSSSSENNYTRKEESNISCKEETNQMIEVYNHIQSTVSELEKLAKAAYGTISFYEYLTKWNQIALKDIDRFDSGLLMKCDDPMIKNSVRQALFFKWVYGKEFIDPSNYGSYDMKQTMGDLLYYLDEIELTVNGLRLLHKNCKVISQTLNIREGPGADYPIIGKLSLNDKVYVEEIEIGWCRIEKENKIGWVSNKYLE